MGTLIKPAGIGATGARLRIRPAVAAGLLGWWWLGASLGQSRTNLADIGLVPAGVTGAPVVAADSLGMKSLTNQLVAPIAEPASCTIIFAAKSADTLAGGANRPTFMGWFDNSAPNNGVTVYIGGTTLLRGNAAYLVGGTPTNILTSPNIPAGFTGWKLFAFVVQDGVGQTLYDLTAGTTLATANTNPRSPATGRDLIIGGAINGNGGMSDMAMAAVYSVALTAAQLATLRTQSIAPFLATRGVTI